MITPTSAFAHAARIATHRHAFRGRARHLPLAIMPAPDCAEPACKSKADAMRNMFAASGKAKAPKTASVPTGGTVAPGSTTSAIECPPDRDELGRHSWTLLHSFAAYFPNLPTSTQSESALNFIRAIAEFYPCRHCAQDFKAGLEESPPRYVHARVARPTHPHSHFLVFISSSLPGSVQSRDELCVWMCEAHNRVNRQLGKPEFNCKIEELDRRWRNGGPKCDDSGLAEDE